jgi:uncharacterized membrane protein
MIRWMIVVISGLIIGGIIHLVTILTLPMLATQDAYARVARISAVNSVSALPAIEPGKELMPMMDPAFAYAACRYDLREGPIKLTLPVAQSYTSVSFYTKKNVAYYAINDRSAGRRIIELYLMTAEQHADVPEDENITAADRLIVDSPSRTGLILLKALAAEPGSMPQAQAALRAANCGVDKSLLNAGN